MTISDDYCYLDLHVHSAEGSDDAGGTVEGYLKWINARREQGYRLDGFVLTEHRRFDPDLDYSELAERYNALVLRGIEVETDVGHVLVYGVTSDFAQEFDLSDVSLPYEEVFRAAWDLGGIAIGAHAGRPRIGLVEHVSERDVPLDGVRIIEALNGGSSDYENAQAHELAVTRGLREVGASDAHYVSGLGRCLTRFASPVRRIEDLVEQLRDHAAEFLPVRLEETKPGATVAARPTTSQLVPSTSGQGDLGGDDLEYDRSVVGKEIPVGRFEVTREAIASYCEALEETNPLYTDEEFAARGPYRGLIAPPGILQTARMGQPPDPKVQFGNQAFMAGSRQEYFRPIRPGDVIEGYAQVREVYEKTGRSGRMVFIVRRTRYVNQHGEDVAAMDHSMVMRDTRPLDGGEGENGRNGGAS